MKFQDNISNMNTYTHTYIHTDKPKPICPPLFQSWRVGGGSYCENAKKSWSGGGGGGGVVARLGVGVGRWSGGGGGELVGGGGGGGVARLGVVGDVVYGGCQPRIEGIDKCK